jgi:hypothetical protein
MPGPGEWVPGLRKGDIMKKQETKKLTLSRETVRNLEGVALTNVQGGVTVPTSDGRTCQETRTCYC